MPLPTAGSSSSSPSVSLPTAGSTSSSPSVPLPTAGSVSSSPSVSVRTPGSASLSPNLGVHRKPLFNSGLQHREISNNECAVCIGAYDDDVIDGELQREWIRCTNVHSCGKWMHCDCIYKNPDGSYKCNICSTCFA